MISTPSLTLWKSCVVLERKIAVCRVLCNVLLCRAVCWSSVSLAAVAVFTVYAAGPSHAQTRCDVKAHPSWTPPEIAAWEQLCVGQWADFGTTEQVPHPSKPAGWNSERELRSAFIERLMTDDDYVKAIDRHGIRLKSALFREVIDIESADAPFPLRCQNCRIRGINGDEFVGGTLDLRGSTITHDINLTGAKIGGQLLLSRGTEVYGVLNADRATILGNAALREGSSFRDIDLTSADIGGQLNLSDGSAVAGAIKADRVNVHDSIFMRDGSVFSAVLLRGANVGGALSLSGGVVVSGTVYADRVTVAGSVFLRDGSTFEDVRLLGADIGGWMILNRANWADGAAIDLRDAHIGGLWVDAAPDRWPNEMSLDGLTYDSWVAPKPASVDAAWFIDWLDRLVDFSPSPYDQLASVLDAQGYPDIATDVRYQSRALEHYRSRGLDWASRGLHWIVLGYGLRPWRALLCFVTIWFVGFMVLRNDDRWHPREAAIYSLDRLLPAVELADRDFPKQTAVAQFWMLVQQVLGWVLTLFIVAWLGGLLVQG